MAQVAADRGRDRKVNNTEASRTRSVPVVPKKQNFLPVDYHLGMRIVRDFAVSRDQRSRLPTDRLLGYADRK
jgi:hypothetical protein